MVTATKTTRTRKRKSRSSVSDRNDVLKVENKDPNFEYRIVNDKPGRVAQMESRDWELVTDGKEKLLSTFDSSSTSDTEKHVGDGMKAVLMKIPKDWYEEDQKEKSQHIDRIEAKQKPNDIKNGYGKVEITQN